MTGKHTPEATALLRRVAQMRREGQALGYMPPEPPRGGELTLDDLLRFLVDTSAAHQAEVIAQQLNTATQED